VLFAGIACAQGNLLPNPSFEEGEAAPAGWEMSAEAGGLWAQEGRTGDRCIAVEGDGKDSIYWLTDAAQFEPGRTYQVSCWLSSEPGTTGTCCITGPSFANRDFHVSEEWAERKFVFTAPATLGESYVRFGQWHVKGTVYYDDVSVMAVEPAHRQEGERTLGDGETLTKEAYTFRSSFGGIGTNCSRILHRHTAHFNSTRWVFFPGAEVIYRHDLPGLRQTSATVEVTIGYYTGSICIVEASGDGQSWDALGEIAELKTESFELPAALFPAEEVFVRLRSPGEGERGDSEPGSFQVYAYNYRASLAEPTEAMRGATSFLLLKRTDERLAVEVESLGGLLPGLRNEAQLRLTNPGAAALQVTARLTLTPAEGEPVVVEATATVPGGGETTVSLPYTAGHVGSYEASLQVLAQAEPLYEAGFSFSVPELYRSNFGYALSSDDACDLWWCESTYKVNRDRPAPKEQAEFVRIEAARGEYEPVQIVLRPKRAFAKATASVSDFTGPGGATIGSDAVDLLSVAYVPVSRPTDRQGCVGEWPDPLPPVEGGFDAGADKNRPLWLRVHVPRDAVAGDYQATLSLKADAWQAEVPLRLRVFDFTLPEKLHMSTAFGFSFGNVRRYHHLETDEQEREVFDLYMRDFKAHGINPYSPFALGSMKVELEGVAWNGGEIVVGEPPEGKQCMKVEDRSEKGSPAASATKRIEVDPTKSYRLAFSARTAEPGHEYMITMGSHDADGKWISGRNLDFVFTGDGAWQRQEVHIPPEGRAEQCRSLGLSLRGTRWTDAGERVGTTWYDDIFFGLAEEGSPNLVQDAGFEGGSEDARLVVDFADFDRECEKYLDGLGLQTFRLPIGHMPWKEGLGQVGPYRGGSPGYERIMGEYLHTIQEHLREKGWLDEAFTYWIDEPAPEHYEAVRYGNDLLDRYAPDLRRMLTEEPGEELFGYVDIWCPVLYNYAPEICQARQAAGDTRWWYVCCGPRSPYAGLFIDHNAVDLRIWQWMAQKWGVEGCLIWTTNYWHSRGGYPDSLQNPWEDPMSYPPRGGYWGNGDGRFIYPPPVDPNSEYEPIISGPIASIRWEMLREGLEDFEYFYLLTQALKDKPDAAAQKLLEVPEEIVVDAKDFSRDPLLMYEHRRKVAEAIERLGGR
jgi:hypothetical protein